MDVLTQKFVKTRKPHTCFGCGRAFPARRQIVPALTKPCGRSGCPYILLDTENEQQVKQDE